MPDRKTNIALIGFMGTGKTAVGKLLAEKLSRKFIELDWIIEGQAGKPIPRIFREEGEIAFREREIAATKSVAGEQRCVIACGGGIVLNKINIDRLRESGRTVCLAADVETILKRTALAEGARPLLAVEDPTRTVRDLMAYRKPYYERASDFTVKTDGLNQGRVAERIIELLKADESFDL